MAKQGQGAAARGTRDRAGKMSRSGTDAPVVGLRSVTVKLAESPLGWLFSRGLLSRRQFDAGERLRCDWERAQLAPRVTMAWDAAPVARGRGGSAAEPDLNGAQLDAKRRFEDAVASAGPAACRHPVADRLCRRRHARSGDARSAGRRAPASWC